LARAGVAGILRGSSLLEGLTKIVGASIVITIARIVGALHLSAAEARAGIAALRSSGSDVQSLSIKLTTAWNWVVRAGDLSILHALALVASISFVKGGTNLDNSAHMVTRAHFLVPHNFGVSSALAGLTAIGVTNVGGVDGVSLSVVFAMALFGVTSDHASLGAGTCVASIGVDP